MGHLRKGLLGLLRENFVWRAGMGTLHLSLQSLVRRRPLWVGNRPSLRGQKRPVNLTLMPDTDKRQL